MHINGTEVPVYSEVKAFINITEPRLISDISGGIFRQIGQRALVELDGRKSGNKELKSFQLRYSKLRLNMWKSLQQTSNFIIRPDLLYMNSLRYIVPLNAYYRKSHFGYFTGEVFEDFTKFFYLRSPSYYFLPKFVILR